MEKSVTVHGKCYAISDGDRAGIPLSNQDLNDELWPQLQVQQPLQINTKIYQCRKYMDHDVSIKLGDGGRSEEKRPQIREVGVGQRRRGAMLSNQSKGINERFVFSWLPPDVLTGWPSLLKSSFINLRFGWLILPKPSIIKPRLEDELQPKLQGQQLCQNDPTTTSSYQYNNISTPLLYGPWHIY